MDSATRTGGDKAHGCAEGGKYCSVLKRYAAKRISRDANTYHNIADCSNAGGNCQECHQTCQANVEPFEGKRHGVPLELHHTHTQTLCVQLSSTS